MEVPVEKSVEKSISKHKSYRVLVMSILFCGLAAIALLGSSYAWFSDMIRAQTEVLPVSGSASAGDIGLQISGSSTGPFGEKANLTRLDRCQVLYPVSTANLEQFYGAKGQNTQGKVAVYEEITDDVLEHILYGELFLKPIYQDGQLYLEQSAFTVIGNPQLLASARLGMRFHAGDTTNTYIFPLETTMSGVVSQETSTGGTQQVVSAVSEQGVATFVTPELQDLRDYQVPVVGEQAVVGNQSALCNLVKEQVVRVEVWIYMEGCDPESILEAQDEEIQMNLAFAADSQ